MAWAQQPREPFAASPDLEDGGDAGDHWPLRRRADSLEPRSRGDVDLATTRGEQPTSMPRALAARGQRVG